VKARCRLSPKSGSSPDDPLFCRDQPRAPSSDRASEWSSVPFTAKAGAFSPSRQIQSRVSERHGKALTCRARAAGAAGQICDLNSPASSICESPEAAGR
jgi:hypothetical protein